MVTTTFRFVLFMLSLACSPQVLANSAWFQAEPARPYGSLALEFQAYPTGLISGVTYERFFTQTDAWHARIAGQVIRHEDFGEHDDERGDGFGATLGYRRYKPSGLSFGVRVDLWANSLDWTDNIGEPNERTGHTDVLVLQPVAEVAWRKFFTPHWFVQPSGAVGAEINIQTDGEDTGQGLIYLGAISIGRSL